MGYRYHTYDESVLEESGDLELSIGISGIYEELNADGSTASATITVKSPTLRHTLLALGALGEDQAAGVLQGFILQEATAQGISEEQIDTLDDLDSQLDEAFPELAAALADSSQWRTYPLALSLENQAGETSQVEVEIHAPGYMAAWFAASALTSEKLNGLLASFMPLDEEF